jgi:hypothetical protein
MTGHGWWQQGCHRPTGDASHRHTAQNLFAWRHAISNSSHDIEPTSTCCVLCFCCFATHTAAAAQVMLLPRQQRQQ